MIWSFIDNITTETWSLALFTWNVVPVVAVVWIRGLGGLAFELARTSGVIYISDIIHSFDHDKSNYISQLVVTLRWTGVESSGKWNIVVTFLS